MKNKIQFALFGLLLFTQIITSQSRITISCNHADAKIFKVVGDTKVEPAIGIGSAELKLFKNDLNKIRIEKEGYETVERIFPKSQKWPKNVVVNLENRIIEFTAEPFDALIFVEGNYVGKKAVTLIVKKDQTVTVDVKKEGYQTISKTYYNSPDKDIPPFKDAVKLTNRVVDLKVFPNDAEIFVDKVSKGIGSSVVTIEEGKCVLVSVEKEGYINEEKVFCNKPNDPVPPLKHQISLVDRLVKLSTTPDNTEIMVDGKVVGVGNYDLKITKDNCVDVLFNREGYLNIKKSYCNRDDYQEPPSRDHVELEEDEAFKTSISTDFANVNFNIVVRSDMSEEDAWKILSQIVTTQFDVLEVIDKETGYLRTAWQVQSFNGKSTIRTRVIVKFGDSNPLKYVMKINSERAEGIVSVKDDQEFTEWGRILKKYQNIIEEAQSRL